MKDEKNSRIPPWNLSSGWVEVGEAYDPNDVDDLRAHADECLKCLAQIASGGDSHAFLLMKNSVVEAVRMLDELEKIYDPNDIKQLFRFNLEWPVVMDVGQSGAVKEERDRLLKRGVGEYFEPFLRSRRGSGPNAEGVKYTRDLFVDCANFWLEFQARHLPGDVIGMTSVAEYDRHHGGERADYDSQDGGDDFANTWPRLTRKAYRLSPPGPDVVDEWVEFCVAWVEWSDRTSVATSQRTGPRMHCPSFVIKRARINDFESRLSTLKCELKSRLTTLFGRPGEG